MQRSTHEELAALRRAHDTPRAARRKPAPRRRSVWARLGWAPWVWVVLPTLLASIYYGLVASDRYVSESSFVIRAAERQTPGGLMGNLLTTAGLSGAQDDSRVVHHFVRSRDAMLELDRELGLREAFSSGAIDRLSRFPRLDFDQSDEALLAYYRGRISIELDSQTSLSVLRVTGFEPEFAQRLNAELLAMSERIVNQLNDRLRKDAQSQAESEVSRAERASRDAATRIAEFRSANGVFDPDRQSLLQINQAAKLREELLAAQSQLALLRAVSPDNPQVPLLSDRARMLEKEISRDGARVTGGSSSFSRKAAEMQGLVVQQASADRQLAMALSAMEQARNEVRRKTLYLERVSQPHRPDAAVEPRRVHAVATVLVVGLLLWGLTSLLGGAVREHRA
jgi:capsular polysaccharide transport system permease protein